MIREADTGHVAQTILAAADEVGASLIVLGTREDTDLPRTPLDMATHLPHLSTLPVLIVPREPAVKTGARAPAGQQQLPVPDPVGTDACRVGRWHLAHGVAIRVA
jgi:hypothetical protein